MSEEEKKRPIAICTHAFDRIDFDVHFNHCHAFACWAKTYELVFVGKKGLSAARARNALVEKAFEKNCSHMLFVDADHFIPTQMLPLLLESKDEAIVSGLVCKRGERFQQIVFAVNKDGKYMELDLPLDGKLYEVGVCAFGCTLVNMDKLAKIKKPYFRDTCEVVEGEPVNMRSDINICNMFRDIGERVWVDTRVLIGHLGISDIIYPQNAATFHKLYDVVYDSRKLKVDQQGFCYLP